MNPDAVRRLFEAGCFEEALALLADVHVHDATTTLLVAEAHERLGDMLWFHDRPGSGEPYRKAMQTLVPGPGGCVRDAAEARHRQECWSRIAAKLLHGTGPDGRRRPGATGRPHPHGDPPHAPPSLPEPEPAVASAADVAPANEPTTVANPICGSPQAMGAAPEPGASHAPETPAEAASAAAESAAPQPPARRPHREDRGPLLVGNGYRIVKSFRDFDGIEWPVGTELVYRGSDYSPRDEGLVLFFDRGSIRLCGLFAADNAVLDRLEDHFAPAEPTPPTADGGPCATPA